MQNNGILTRIEPYYLNCPVCGEEGAVYRSHSRNLLEKIVKALRLINVYRCHKCNWRGYRPVYKIKFSVLKNISMTNIALYIVLIFTCIIFVVSVLKAFINKN